MPFLEGVDKREKCSAEKISYVPYRQRIDDIRYIIFFFGVQGARYDKKKTRSHQCHVQNRVAKKIRKVYIYTWLTEEVLPFRTTINNQVD